MMYGIMRIEKRVKSAVYGCQIENNRTRSDHENGRDFSRSEIDWSKTDKNVFLVKSDSWNKKINSVLKDKNVKARKNSVLLIDGLYTVSPCPADDFDYKNYFFDCIRYHVKEYCGGDPSLVVNCVVHFDEKTPHMHLCSVPVYKKENGSYGLSADRILGNRYDFQKHQNRFFDDVAQKYGCERGDHDKRKHLDMEEYRIKTAASEAARLESENMRIRTDSKRLADKVQDVEKKVKSYFLDAPGVDENVKKYFTDMLDQNLSNELKNISRDAR